jgi:asparagine synthase (glutamine-hydrolysing)
MFRYIGLAWDEAIASRSATAQQLSLGLQAQAGWLSALLRPGLHVFTAGARQGVNGVYPLPADQGAVVGKLFRRRDLDRPVSMDLTLTTDEGTRILRSGGRALVDEHWGRYVAFLHAGPGGARVLRDPSGALPCYRLQHEGVWIVFSWLEDVLATMPCVPAPTVNWECLAAHVLLMELGGHETALDGVRQVLPGEAVPLGQAEERPTLLWNGVDIARAAAHIEPAPAADSLRQTVRGCAQSWAACHDRILLRLSGGVDSSILLSCLASGSTPALVTCVNYHSPGADSDERQYARLAATRARRTLIERERDTAFRLKRVLDVARTPTPSTYVGRMGTARMDAELAATHGAAAMFTGGGGDQLFFELRTWWPAADYLRSRGLDGGFVAAAMDAARLGRVSVWKTLRLALTDCIRPTDPWQDAGKHLTLARRDALPQPGQFERFTHPALRSVKDLPIGKLTQTHQLMYPIDYYDPYELEAAPELLNPLLSQPLIELCLKLPTYVLTHGGRGRALARQAFAADMPVEIATRRSKGGMEEHARAVLLRNLDFVRSLLLDGQLVGRGILDRAKVEVALSSRPSAQAGHVSEIHTYVGIEAWLGRWSAQPRQRAS